ncbi:C-Maf-inducing protein-like [Chelonus insularis]|uniref:C-Maf-inducing protein-like n=1 Tax=Chelonus insularis TaxID=460826 RepID=UPI00158D1798|nr:C-Maf-inducing protein-like [Chelonus insularis]XP_034942859.1 C-Maf-inducing protein-like [Chelonus insularis]
MFCFQSPFTRTPRSSVTTPALPTQQTTKSGNTLKTRSGSETRRSSEAVSEGSGSSSIQYIDNEVSISASSSTDTLPGIKADYLEIDPLSPDSTPLDTLDISVTTNDIEEASLPEATGRWRRKLLGSDSSASNEDVNSSSPFSNISTSSSSSKNCQRSSRLLSTPLMTREDVDIKKKMVGGIKASSANDIPSLDGFSEEEVEEEEEEEDESCCEAETETEEGSSLPSSPAAAISVGLAPVQVPYYSFLSVNGGAMRQETTSTSSPQLSSGVATRSNDSEPSATIETSSVTGKCTPVGMSLKKTDTLDPPSLPAARSCPNLEQQSGCLSTSGSSSPSPSPGPAGPRFKPVEEGDIQVCYLNHTRTLVSKILSSKFLRRWETHHLYLNDACLSSKTLTGFLQQPVPYSNMTEVYAVARWDPTYKYCLRIVLPDGSLLLQASNAYTRNQWYHSILWKKSIFKYQHTVSTKTKEEVILKELKSMVDFALWTPLQDERVNGAPLEAVAKLLEDPITQKIHETDEKKILEAEENFELRRDQRRWAETVLSVAAPLLEKAAPPPILARTLANLTQEYPRSSLVPALAPAITRCLKHTVDFGKSPDMRKLIQMFIAALYENDDGGQSIREYISSIHGPGSDCPHPRILPNLVSICVAAIFHRFEIRNCESGEIPSLPPLQCYLLVLTITSEYGDWRPGLSALLQPVPFPEGALANKEVQEAVMLGVMRRLTADSRCTVHRVLLPVREPRPGWIHITAPSSPTCPDDGTLFGEMLTTSLGCCCRRKKFISSLLKQTGSACILLAVRGCAAAQEALCLMLEWRILPNEEARLQVVSALQSSPSGKERYAALCQRQRNLQELQQKGGPKKLTLPVRATDADVALLLGGGALGNLECLSLAFTSVTSACAEQLIKLPALRYLNLWATQFGDAGLQMISEHLQKLQVLNLCETPVSDKGISTLASLTSLRKLNLNSTKLSAQTFESLKKRLPALQEFDVRYTEAW